MAKPGAGGPLLEARGIVVRIGRHELLSGVDLELSAGEILSLIGPNGAGKTTLVRVLLGVLRPSAGRVVRRPGLVVGYVPQRLHLDPTLPLPVRHFLALGGRRRDPASLAAALAEVGAGHLERALMSELSGGEFQRATLARALVRDPDLLILDEPAQGVDFNGQLELYALIERVRNDARLRRAAGQPRSARGHGGDRSGDLPQPPRLLRRPARGGEPASGVSQPVRGACRARFRGLHPRARPCP